MLMYENEQMKEQTEDLTSSLIIIKKKTTTKKTTKKTTTKKKQKQIVDGTRSLSIELALCQEN